ncbi:Fanconi anemia group M protein-like [Babylonia areolata]|uniref:Fanconi anemia group M protein-like n=1 Tax=Babylonia areolata TaxID=304850 RepID=UPI003FD6B545
MNKPRQATLFQSWGSKSQSQQAESSSTEAKQQKKTPKESCSWEDPHDAITLLDSDEDDQELALALEESLAQYNQSSKAGGSETDPQACPQAHQEFEPNDGNVSFGIEDQDAEHGIDRHHCLSQWNATDTPVGELVGYDPSAGQLWIYPTNYPVREYQFNIVRQALVKNTLVTLPTGLGKTFIASVLMYNFYRWYPEAKVVFMAPTKPLVAQQIEACYNIMGIPRQDTAEMTGSMNPTERQKAWRDRRVFFLTPQVMTNDLSRGTCIAEAIKCVVVDEAHKALGNHAYCQVVRELVKYTQQFRVLALSATPGSDIKAIQKVVSNLLISHIELRSEDSPDIKPYTHERTVEKIVVPLGEELNRIKLKYTQVLQVVVKRLTQQRVLYNRDTTSLSKFLILKARDAFRQNPPETLPRSQYGIVEGDFALAMSLYHGFELLQLHGLRSLHNFLEGIVNGTKSYGRTRTELMKNADFNEVKEILNAKFQPSGQPQDRPAFLVGHPKLVKLEEVVLEHFHRFQAAGQATRVMIFSQYRDSVQEITAMLQQHDPLVKVMSFIGQSSVGKSTKGFTQKEQLKVMQAFRTGGYNTLVSTCVGEEGLDIGDVDLIVCYDAHKSPVRLVQRMGRTGRKRQGRIVMLMTEGKEEQIYNHSQYTKRSIHRAILNGARTLVFYANNPRMIPAEVTPACHRMHITVQAPQPAGQPEGGGRPKGRGRGRSLGPAAKGKAAQTKKGGTKDGGISLEEFVELKSAGCAVTARRLPRPTMLALNDAEQGDADEEDHDKLSLADWLPWQNGLQETSLFGHSKRSHHLVSLLEFTDLQQALPRDEDNYGQEMNLYLHMEDVLPDSKNPASSDITQFLLSSTRNQHSRLEQGEKPEVQLKKGGLLKKTEVSSKRKRKRVIQDMDLLEQSDDSDFLPDIDLNTASVVSEKGETRPGDKDKEEMESGSVSLPQEDLGLRMETEASEVVNEVLPSDLEEDNAHIDAGDKGLDSEVPKFVHKPSKRRLPTPPPVEEIGRLLSDIRPEDWALVDVQTIMKDEEGVDDQALCFWAGPPVIPDTLFGGESLCDSDNEGIGPNRNSDNEDMIEHDRKNETEAETSVVFDLEDLQREMENSRVETGTLGSENIQALEKPVQVQTDFSNAVPQCEKHISESEQNTIKKLSRPDGRASITRDDQPARPGLSTDCPNSSPHTSPDCDTPGKQHNQSCTDVKKTPAAGHKSFYDASVSDSFFHKNFFDDDDEDFEETPKQPQKLTNTSKERNVSPEVCQEHGSRVMAHSLQPPVAVTSSVSTPAAVTPISGTANVSKNTSMFTFSQALSFVHNHSVDSQLTDSHKTNLHTVGNVPHEEAEKASAGVMKGKEKEVSGKDEQEFSYSLEDEDSANFDLGFDFDEDIIPPSPEAEGPSVSQAAMKSVMGTSSVAAITATKGDEDPSALRRGNSPNVDDFDDDDDGILLDMAEQDTEQGSPSFSSSFQPKQIPKDLGTRKVLSQSEIGKVLSATSSTAHIVNEQFKDEQFEVSDDFPEVQLPKLTKRKLSLGSKYQAAPKRAKTEVEPSIKSSKSYDDSDSSDGGANNKTLQKTVDRSPVFDGKDHPPCGSTDSLPKAHTELKLSSIGTSHPKNDISFLALQDIPPELGFFSDDNDFDIEPDPKTPFTEVSHLERSPVSADKRGAAVFCSTPVNVKQPQNWNSERSRIASASTMLPPAFPLELEDDDFEESLIVRKKPKVTRFQSPDSTDGKDESDVQTECKLPPKKKQKCKERKGRHGFLDMEAELSDDVAVSSDEEEENTEMLEGSFIDNCTQMTQASQIDMQAVYMKSVRSPVHHGAHQKGRYRLQFNPAPVSDVYSQLPSHLEEESQYQEDSFCVGSDEESSYYNSEEEVSLEERVAGSKRKRRPAVKQLEGRKRVHQLVDSSSNEDEDFDRLPPSQIVPPRTKARSAKAFLSSSDEVQEVSVADDSSSSLNIDKHKQDGDIDRACPSKCVQETEKSSQGFSVSASDRAGTSEGANIYDFSTGSKIKDDEVSDSSKSRQWQRKSLSKSNMSSSSNACADQKAGAQSFKKPSHSDLVKTVAAENLTSASVSKPSMSSASVSCDVSSKSTGRSGRSGCVSEDTLAHSLRIGTPGSGSGAGGDADRQKDVAVPQPPCSEDGSSASTYTSIAVRERGETVVLVDSREISGAQDIVSALRLKHQSCVCTRQLAACDYILSNRLAVERVSWSNFCNGSNRSKLSERLQQMQSLYDRCVVIVEKDRVKPGEEKNKRLQHHTKYVDTLTTQLCQTTVRLFFTDNQNETANLLAQLTTIECRKGMAIRVPVSLSPGQEQVVRFYLSLPKLCITHALNLCFNFRTIHEFMQSSVSGVQTKGHMSFSRATEVVNYVRRRFSLALCSNK